MADHTDFLAMAREMIKEDGRLVSCVKLSKGPADANKPWKGAGVPTETGAVSAYAVFLPHAGELDLGRIISDADLLKKVEQIALIAPPSGGQNLDDYTLIIDGGERWRIEVMRTLKPGPIALLHVAGLCR